MSKKIIVKGLNWIGDAVMASPFFKSLKDGLPDSEISVLARPWTAEVYKTNPYIDEVISVDDKKEKFAALKILNSRKFDIGILLPKSLSSALLFKFGGVDYISGWDTQLRGYLLANKLKLTDELKKKHQVFLHLELAYANGGKIIANPKLILNTRPETDEFVKNEWFKENTNYFGINSGAAFGPAKRWLPEYFAQVINYMHKNYNYKPVLFGAENERNIVLEIIKNIDTDIEYINLTGRTNLQQLFSSIKQCGLFLTNDSGPMHIAAALNVPQAAIFGSTNSVTTGPFSENAIVVESNIECAPCIEKRCKFNTYECMKIIKPEKVINELQKKIMV